MRKYARVGSCDDYFLKINHLKCVHAYLTKRAVIESYVVLTEDWVPSDSVSTEAQSMRMIGSDHYQRVGFVSEIDSGLYSLREFHCLSQ